jgi:hypothetical protein
MAIVSAGVLLLSQPAQEIVSMAREVAVVAMPPCLFHLLSMREAVNFWERQSLGLHP